MREYLNENSQSTEMFMVAKWSSGIGLTASAVLQAPEISGWDVLYGLVMKHDNDRYIEGNFEGPFLTGNSQGAIFFGIIHAIGSFGLTVMDSSFW